MCFLFMHLSLCAFLQGPFPAQSSWPPAWPYCSFLFQGLSQLSASVFVCVSGWLAPCGPWQRRHGSKWKILVLPPNVGHSCICNWVYAICLSLSPLFLSADVSGEVGGWERETTVVFTPIPYSLISGTCGAPSLISCNFRA